MRKALFISACLLGLSTTASAACFSVYGPKNQLVRQSTTAPIDLSLPISQAMQRRFPGQYMVWTEEDDTCREIGNAAYTTSRSDVAGNPAITAGSNRSPIEASPIFREITPGRSAIYGDAPDRAAARRDAAIPPGTTPVPDAAR